MIEKLELELSKLDICIDFNALLHQTHKNIMMLKIYEIINSHSQVSD